MDDRLGDALPIPPIRLPSKMPKRKTSVGRLSKTSTSRLSATTAALGISDLAAHNKIMNKVAAVD
jgi:hypothetical protein